MRLTNTNEATDSNVSVCTYTPRDYITMTEELKAIKGLLTHYQIWKALNHIKSNLNGILCRFSQFTSHRYWEQYRKQAATLKSDHETVMKALREAEHEAENIQL